MPQPIDSRWLLLALATSLCSYGCRHSTPGVVHLDLADSHTTVDAQAERAMEVPDTERADSSQSGPEELEPADLVAFDTGDHPDLSSTSCEPPFPTCTGQTGCTSGTCPSSRPQSPAVAVCAPTGRGTCSGCGDYAHDQCAPGYICLYSACPDAYVEDPGICVTREELRSICETTCVDYFDCRWCGGELCNLPLPTTCADNASELAVFTSRVWVCISDRCQRIPDHARCETGYCEGAECRTLGCQPATDVPTGAWTLVKALADLPLVGLIDLAQADCYSLGLDQVLYALQIDADGKFHGPPYTDYGDTWTGCIVDAQAGWRLDVKACDFVCYDHNRVPGRLGTMHRAGSDLVVTRTGRVNRSLVGDPACANVPASIEEVPLTLRYQLAR